MPPSSGRELEAFPERMSAAIRATVLSQRRALLSKVRSAARWSPLVLGTLLLAQRAIGGILGKLGHPGAPLDDAYIHFQYARAFAEGHPFRFQAAEPISTGATSFLWPMLLAPFYAVGFRGESILWPAWILSFAALGALAHEAYALAKPLTDKPAAIGAGAMVLGFGGFAWCAASGMEVVPFAWLLAFSARHGAQWAERREARTRRALFMLIALAFACPLMRPEGSLTSIALGMLVATHPRALSPATSSDAASPTDRASKASRVLRALLPRLEGAPLVAGALFPTLLLYLLTGSATSSTAQVKLLPGNPYFSVYDATLANARILVGTILDGQAWSAEFLPKGGAVIACVGLAALVWRGQVTHKGVRAALVLLLALSMFVPCLYVTFLWNRLRYLWPFATGWIIGLACLARALAELARRVDARAATAVAALVTGGFAGTFVVRLEWVLEDVAQSASGIDRQQATLGRWARATLPPTARIGVNDTGAIAYFSDRTTFDVVGLTTATEGRYWVAGAASRLEHYERMRATSPDRLPTHFIVYPEWMALEPVIGATLHEATVTDATILGGQTMRASEARWTHLGSGEAAWTKLTTKHDVVDVADLESERAHGYELLGARDGEQVVREENAPDGSVVLDGGRTNRAHDRFFARLPAGGALVGVARVESTPATKLRVRVGGKEIATLDVPEGPWTELRFDVPAEARGERVAIDVVAEGPSFSAFHYWFGAP